MFLLPRAATATLAFLLMSAAAHAQGVVDQQNDPASTSGLSCGSPPMLNSTVLQSFVPQADSLVAVELRLQAGSAFPAEGTTTTARIRQGTSSGTVLGEATASLAGPMSQGAQALVRFDFSAIPLTTGTTYLIEWVTPPSTVLVWVSSTGDPYPAGTAFSCSGNVWPVTGTDLNFVTYAAAPEPPAEEQPTSGETPGDCGTSLDRLRELVSALESRRFKKCVLERLLAQADRELDRGKPKAASALVLAVEVKVRALAHVGFIDEDEAAPILVLTAKFRDCLGVGPRASHGWDLWKSRHRRS